MPLTEWTEEGLAYKARLSADHSFSMPVATPGTHYVVREPADDEAHLTFVNVPEMTIVRHRWVLIRKHRLEVPQPTNTPLLKKNMNAEERALILSVYFRPWTLLRAAASPYVPFLTDLDLAVTDIRSRCKRRIRGKQADLGYDGLQRSMAQAWDDYRLYHIASKHSTSNNWEYVFLLFLIPNFYSGDIVESST